MFFHRPSGVLIALITGFLVSASFSHAAGPSFSVSFPRNRSEKPLDGRIFLRAEYSHRDPIRSTEHSDVTL